MTTQEFSDSFDTLINSYAQKAEFGEQFSSKDIVLDEYEKSCFLTLAQEELVLSYYNGNNSNADSFEKTEEVRRYLSGLVETEEISPTAAGSIVTLNTSSQIFTLPNDLWFITYESAILGSSTDNCTSGKMIQVLPVTQDTLYRIIENPFKGPGYRRALRLDIADNKVELISKYTIAKYTVRYLKKIAPIVLIDLPDGLSIKGENEKTECTLHESLHRIILELAVKLALQSKGIQIKQN